VRESSRSKFFQTKLARRNESEAAPMRVHPRGVIPSRKERAQPLGVRMLARSSRAPPQKGARVGRVGRTNQERTRWDPKDGDLCLARTKPGETLVEVRSDSDVQIDRRSWV